MSQKLMPLARSHRSFGQNIGWVSRAYFVPCFGSVQRE